tara:strand:- start:83 stop:301 length:219 start_codon:yes stop_codon:yes gene_type:complete
MPQPIMKKYTQGEMGMEYGLPAKEKPQAGLLKMYSQGELSNVADGAPAKEKPQGDMLKMYSQGDLSKVADGK